MVSVPGSIVVSAGGKISLVTWDGTSMISGGAVVSGAGGVVSTTGSGMTDGVGYVTNKGSGDGCITGSESTSGGVSGSVFMITIGLAGIGSVTGA